MYANEHVKMTYFSHVYVMEGLFILIVCKDVVLSHLAFNFTKLVWKAWQFYMFYNHGRKRGWSYSLLRSGIVIHQGFAHDPVCAEMGTLLWQD